MHIHQQNHWNDILFYWYQSYHWYQWTIGLTNRIRLCILDMCGGTNVPYFKACEAGARKEIVPTCALVRHTPTKNFSTKDPPRIRAYV